MTLSPSTQKLIKKRIIYPLQALGIYALFYFYKLLSLDQASDLGGWFGRVLGPRFGANKKTRRNISLAMPELSRAEQDVIIKGMWENLGRVIAEYSHLDALDHNRVEVIGAEHLQTLKDAGRPAILVSGHLANWEALPIASAKRGLELHLIYRHANNPYVDRLLSHARTPMGQHLARKGFEGARSVHSALSNGQMIGMLVDQKYRRGREIPFFNRPAMTAPAFAELALQYNAPILMVHGERLQGAHFRITIQPPLELPQGLEHQATVDAILTTVNAELERWIRRKPGEWLWLHRRW